METTDEQRRAGRRTVRRTAASSSCKAGRCTRIELFAMMLSVQGASSFVLPVHAARRRPTTRMSRVGMLRGGQTLATEPPGVQCTWSPQDLTQERPGFLPIPEDDYVKQYQRCPQLWPVEFFVIAYRRTVNEMTQRSETQVLVRKSANGTSKWGVGTGVPATRWMLSTQERPPLGYEWSPVSTGPGPAPEDPPRVRFEAINYPEFPADGQPSWAYDKIDIREDALNGAEAAQFRDPELEAFARNIREGLRTKLAAQRSDGTSMGSWEASTLDVVSKMVDKANSVAAIQGSLRMSGLFARKAFAAGDGSGGPRYVGLGESAPEHVSRLVQSVRVFTMFPQMPYPMPSPSTSPEELQQEIASRDSRMAESGRDPHQDAHGRRYTHKSTSNVSNTIHGVYFVFDATDLPGLDEVPALDLFGTKEIRREWKSLEELKVLDADGTLGTEDTKSSFISGFIVRQLVREGVIDIQGP
jgi:hypothetical protein